MKSNIFAEMLPTQKAQLISDLQQLDYTVGMCGDGSNDSLALSTADVSHMRFDSHIQVGLSISEAETSFAAPFTSETKHCVSFMIRYVLVCMTWTLICRESRALLAKILNNFKFIAVFILTQICVSLYNQLKLYKQPQFIWVNCVVAFLFMIASMSNMCIHELPHSVI